MTDRNDIEILFEARARADNGGSYAIAYALLQQTHALAQVARALRDLGNGDAATHMGALEALGAQIEKAANIIVDRS